MRPILKDGIIIGGVPEPEDEADLALNLGLFCLTFFFGLCTCGYLALPALLLCGVSAIFQRSVRMRWALASVALAAASTILLYLSAIAFSGDYQGILG